MVKILFVGDTHLDVAQPHPIARQRKKEFQHIFQQVIDAAIAQQVDLVCHLGDLFDKPRPSPVEVKFAVTQLIRLNEKGIKFYGIRGNHEGSADLEDLFSGWAGEYIELPDISAIQLIDPSFDEARHSPTIGYRDLSDQIRIYGIGHYRHETIAVIKKYMPLESIDSSKFNILLLHGFVETVNDAYPFTQSEKVLPADEIMGLNCDLVALGHSHSQVEPKKLQNSTFFSPGSPIDFDFNHLGSHGFYITVVDGASKHATFHWHTIEPEYVMQYLRIDGKKAEHHMNWYDEQLRQELTTVMNTIKKKLILGVHFKGIYAPNSPRFEIDALRVSIQKLVGDRLLFLGTISLKGLQYKALKEVNIADLREIKMDEEQILEILGKSVEPDLANVILGLYKELETAYNNPANLTGKKGELKGTPREALQKKIEETLNTYYRGKISDAELEKVQITPLPTSSAEVTAPTASPTKATKPAKTANPVKKARKPKTEQKGTPKKLDKFFEE